jgi:hypothetical protein
MRKFSSEPVRIQAAMGGVYGRAWPGSTPRTSRMAPYGARSGTLGASAGFTTPANVPECTLERGIRDVRRGAGRA